MSDLSQFEPFSPTEEPDFIVEADGPILADRLQVDLLVHAGVLEPRAGDWGATHYCAEADAWVRAI